jgi:hypothetical protein
VPHATQTLPAGYVPSGSIDLENNQRAMLVLGIASIVALLLFGGLSLFMLGLLRPDVSTGSFSFGFVEIIIGIVALVVLTFVMIVLHELIHGLFFWLFTRTRPAFGFKGAYAYAAAPGWYIPRSQYIIVGLAPLVLITLGGFALLVVVPAWLIPALLFVVVMNGAGAVGDIAVVGWLLVQPRATLVHDLGDAVAIYRPAPAGA